MVLDLRLRIDSYRPVFYAYLNGISIPVLLDTGASNVIFVRDEKALAQYKLKNLEEVCTISGFGGSNGGCSLYSGTFVLSANGKILKFNNIKIAHSPLANKRLFGLLVPITLFNLFDIKISGEKQRWLQVDTKRNDKIVYEPVYNKNMISEILCQTECDEQEVKHFDLLSQFEPINIRR